MSKIDSKDYIQIQGWMLNELNLSGNDLIVYAIIYSYSRNKTSVFCGSRQYLADWCNCTVRGIQKNLNHLLELNLIEIVDKEFGEIVKYRANLKLISGGEQSSQVGVNKVHGGGEQSSHGDEQSSHNNIDYNIDYKQENDNTTILKNSTAEPLSNENSTKKSYTRKRVNINDDFSDKLENKSKEKNSSKKKLSLYEQGMIAIDEFTDDEKLRDALKEYFKFRLDKRQKEGGQFYISNWKSLLAKLKILEGDKLQIVLNATAGGWTSFYPLNKNNNYKNKNQDVFAEGHGVKSIRPEDVEGGGFSGVIF